MDKKNTILVIILILLLLATALLLYRGVSERPLSIVATQVSSDDIIIRNQIDQLDAKIKTAIEKIDVGGALDTLINSEQFKSLSSDALIPIVVGSSGRPNPFLPVATEQLPDVVQ